MSQISLRFALAISLLLVTACLPPWGDSYTSKPQPFADLLLPLYSESQQIEALIGQSNLLYSYKNTERVNFVEWIYAAPLSLEGISGWQAGDTDLIVSTLNRKIRDGRHPVGTVRSAQASRFEKDGWIYDIKDIVTTTGRFLTINLVYP